MRVPRLYHHGDLSVTTVTLTESAAHHAAHVLRLPVHSRVILFNGDGFDYHGTINSIRKKSVDITVENKIEVRNESPLQLSVAIAVIKNDRMDFALQKATELGVTSITPLITEYSNIQIKADKQDKKLEHWQGIIQHACEQCGRAVLPELNSITRLGDWLKSKRENIVILNPLASGTFANIRNMTAINLCIGPEGGFSENELALFSRCQLQQVSMGPRILRAETAVIAGISVLQNMLGDIST